MATYGVAQPSQMPRTECVRFRVAYAGRRHEFGGRSAGRGLFRGVRTRLDDDRTRRLAHYRREKERLLLLNLVAPHDSLSEIQPFALRHSKRAFWIVAVVAVIVVAAPTRVTTRGIGLMRAVAVEA